MKSDGRQIKIPRLKYDEAPVEVLTIETRVAQSNQGLR